MATVNFDPLSTTPTTPVVGNAPVPARPLHRIREVREQQGVSLRSVSRHTGCDVRTLRVQEQETSDLRLSDLYRWQESLAVPVADLLVDSEAPLSRPILERARLVRIMKTAAAIQEQAPTPAVRRMADTLVAQLVELMPELAHVSPWPTYGQRRSLDEFGRVFEQQYSSDLGAAFGDDD